MSIILSDKDLISILILYIEEKTRNGSSKFKFVNSKEEFENFKAEGYVTDEEIDKFKEEPVTAPGMPVKPKPDPNKIIKSLKTWWLPITWKDQNNIYSQCLKYVTGADGNRTAEFNGISYRELKLKKCFKRWDFKDENGKEIPISDNVIDNLHPEVAHHLLQAFEKLTEDEKD